MADKLVSIRMPKPLVQELKSLVVKNHYLDLSEELRSVIRKYARLYLNPQANSSAALRKELEEQLLQKNEVLRKQELLRELKELLEVRK